MKVTFNNNNPLENAPVLKFKQTEEPEESSTVKYDTYTVAQLIKEGVWPHEYNSAWGILPYIRRLGNDVVGVEIGTERGESAYLILERCPNVKLLYTVDPFKGFENWNGPVTQEEMDSTRKIAIQNLQELGARVHLLEMTSQEAFSKLNVDQVDFVFVDGSVDEEDYYWDLSNWYKKLRKGGLFAGHNYQLNTVRDALKRFREEENIRVPINRTENMTYFWTKF